jgi:maleylacetate reductase
MSEARKLTASQGPIAVEVFAEAALHTPIEVTKRAMAVFAASGSDAAVVLAGGPTIGLGKAIVWRIDCLQAVLAATYAGSEVIPILGQAEVGVKTNLRDAKSLSEIVIYDPDLTPPVGISVTSGLNAITGSVKGFQAQSAMRLRSQMAVEGIPALRDALPQIERAPNVGATRAETTYGSWLCSVELALRCTTSSAALLAVVLLYQMPRRIRC